MSNLFDYTAMNKRAWNEIAFIRHKKQQPASFFVPSNSTLDPRELQAAGDVQGKQLLHLQCATGEDTLSWALVGAQVTGVDISESQITLAQQKAAEAHLSVRFVAADIYALPVDLQEETFDIVYTGGGVLCWLPDLDCWAKTIAAALHPGGTFLLFDEHPLATCLSMMNGKLHLESDYFGRGKPEYSQGWVHFQGSGQATETKVEFSWPLGDIVTAIAQAGFRIEQLKEFPIQSGWRFGNEIGELSHLPGDMLLVAQKDRS